LATSHKLVLDSQFITVGTAYHFVIKGIDKAGNRASSSDQTFTTKGTSLLVTVLNEKNNKPVTDVAVSFNGLTVKTDNQGRATLTNMPLGNSVILVNVGGTQSKATVQVTKESTPGDLQRASVKVAVPANIALYVVIGGVFVLLIGTAFAGFKMRRGGGTPLPPPDTMHGDSGSTALSTSPTPPAPIETPSSQPPEPSAPEPSAPLPLEQTPPSPPSQQVPTPQPPQPQPPQTPPDGPPSSTGGVVVG
jgi:hypothetical protein